jgi:hypothetical protein
MSTDMEKGTVNKRARVTRGPRNTKHGKRKHCIVRRLLGDVPREFMKHLSAALHGTLGSYLRDAFQEGSADALACLPVPRG